LQFHARVPRGHSHASALEGPSDLGRRYAKHAECLSEAAQERSATVTSLTQSQEDNADIADVVVRAERLKVMHCAHGTAHPPLRTGTATRQLIDVAELIQPGIARLPLQGIAPHRQKCIFEGARHGSTLCPA
jgi:hypothetical protein